MKDQISDDIGRLREEIEALRSLIASKPADCDHGVTEPTTVNPADALISEDRVSARHARRAYVSLMLYFISFFFNDFNETATYLRMYPTDLHQIVRIGRYMAGDDQPGICFRIAQGTLLW